MDDWNIVGTVGAENVVQRATETFDKFIGFMEEHKQELKDIFSVLDGLDGEQALVVAQTFAALAKENKDSINERLGITE